MKRTSLLAPALLVLGLVFLTAGCASFSNSAASKPRGPLTYALIASVSGGTAPTDAQWATMQQKFSALLTARGLILVTDPSKADKLIQVLFVPDLADPATGISYVVAVRDSPGALLAQTPRAIASGLGYATSASFSPFGSQLQYYGYFNDYTDNYSSTPISSGGSGSRPPGHDGDHHTTRPVDCPPDTPHHAPGGYAGNPPSHSNPPGDGGHWWNHTPRSDSDYSSRSSSSYSSGSSYSSSDYAGPSSSYSAAASSPSISFPSSSSSSSESAPSISFPSSGASSSFTAQGPQAQKP